MSIYTQEAVAAEVNYRLEVARANRRHVSGTDRAPRASWYRRLRAASPGRPGVVRATPAVQ